MHRKKQGECKSRNSNRDWNRNRNKHFSNLPSVLLQTDDLIVENTSCKKQAKIKVLFDQVSQRIYVTKRIKDILRVMKRATSCKYRQAVKTMQFQKKLFKSHLHSSYVRKMC